MGDLRPCRRRDQSRHRSHHHLSPSNNGQGRKLRATIDDVHLYIYLPFEPQLGSKLRLKVEVLAEYPDELSFERWTLLRLEAHIATKMVALLDRHFSENRPEPSGRSPEVVGERIAFARQARTGSAAEALKLHRFGWGKFTTELG